MRSPMTRRKVSRILTPVTLALAVAAIQPTYADGPLGLYVGGTLGRGEVAANTQTLPAFISAGEFKESNATLGAVLGIRPIRYLGAEIGYVDFGRPYGNVGGYRDHVSMQAETAFGVLYLPVPVVDLYGKFGAARMHADANNITYFPPGHTCPAFEPDCTVIGAENVSTFTSRTSTNLAFGAGAQYKFASLHALGSLAMRAEYDRFEFGGQNPSQVALGLIWTVF